jgi:tRNA pseudouridine38-40 synthase
LADFISTSINRFFIEFSYNGTAYYGWQVQPNAHTVQAELDKALSILFRQTINTLAAGRTDSGVHAKQMYAHFDLINTTEELDVSEGVIAKIIHQLNSLLPLDIAVINLIRVKKDAHARFDATLRAYEYWINQHKSPFLTDSSYYFNQPLDIDYMNKIATILFQYEDFSCFSKSKTQVFTNNCTITKAEWELKDDKMIFHISANRFLRNMVRAIVGTLLQVGQHKLDEVGFRAIIDGKQRSNAGVSVPAHGLYLTKVVYPYI